MRRGCRRARVTPPTDSSSSPGARALAAAWVLRVGFCSAGATMIGAHDVGATCLRRDGVESPFEGGWATSPIRALHNRRLLRRIPRPWSDSCLTPARGLAALPAPSAEGLQ